MTGDTPLARLRRQRNAQRVHQIGERAVFELIDELVRHHPAIADDIDRRLGQYAGIDRRVLAAVGGDKFAPWPPRIVGGTS